eukprot:m.345665 g.345665  ORF g.345665 m.345665 type:complete len:751 (+) comp26970_c0_seq1:155-2407(+)
MDNRIYDEFETKLSSEQLTVIGTVYFGFLCLVGGIIYIAVEPSWTYIAFLSNAAACFAYILLLINVEPKWRRLAFRLVILVVLPFWALKVVVQCSGKGAIDVPNLMEGEYMRSPGWCVEGQLVLVYIAVVSLGYTVSSLAKYQVPMAVFFINMMVVQACITMTILAIQTSVNRPLHIMFAAALGLVAMVDFLAFVVILINFGDIMKTDKVVRKNHEIRLKQRFKTFGNPLFFAQFNWRTQVVTSYFLGTEFVKEDLGKLFGSENSIRALNAIDYTHPNLDKLVKKYENKEMTNAGIAGNNLAMKGAIFFGVLCILGAAIYLPFERSWTVLAFLYQGLASVIFPCLPRKFLYLVLKFSLVLTLPMWCIKAAVQCAPDDSIGLPGFMEGRLMRGPGWCVEGSLDVFYYLVVGVLYSIPSLAKYQLPGSVIVISMSVLQYAISMLILGAQTEEMRALHILSGCCSIIICIFNFIIGFAILIANYTEVTRARAVAAYDADRYEAAWTKSKQTSGDEKEYRLCVAEIKKITRKKGRPRQPESKSLSSLYKQAELVQAWFKLRMSIWETQAQELQFKSAGLKKAERTMDKMWRSYRGDCSRVCDLVRGSIVCANFSQIKQILEIISSDDSVEIHRVKDRFADDTAVGYRDLQLSLKVVGFSLTKELMPTDLGHDLLNKCRNHMVEIQIHLKDVFDLKTALETSSLPTLAASETIAPLLDNGGTLHEQLISPDDTQEEVVHVTGHQRYRWCREKLGV